MRMSASSLRYVPAPDQNASLRARIETLAHRHRRYGAGMIYLKLRQAGVVANHKRVDRLGQPSRGGRPARVQELTLRVQYRHLGLTRQHRTATTSAVPARSRPTSVGSPLCSGRLHA